jgi:ribosomal protein L7Ae-like RNA K-turn-binding protein
MRARSVTVGSRETRAALHRGAIRAVLVATDGSARDRERIARIAASQNVPVCAIAGRSDLGSWCGRGAVAVVGIRDAGLATRILQLAEAESASGEGMERHAKDR